MIWLRVALDRARPWDLRPVAEDGPLPSDPPAWPAVRVIVPARNEAEVLPKTLSALLKQDYPGHFEVVVVDDRSSDATADVAKKIARTAGASERLTVLPGQPLPEGWVGKVWALEQGRTQCRMRVADCALDVARQAENPPASCREPEYLWLTDADILHHSGVLKRLVAESEQGQLALNSRMARLRCYSVSERLLIPPFVFFFNLLFPMRRVNNPHDKLAAAAGGCVLLDREALEEVGGFACIKGEIIDDVNLARAIKQDGRAIRLTLSRGDTESLREYETLATIWKMVRRTAFTELRHSYLRLCGALLALALAFVVPLVLTAVGAGVMLYGLSSETEIPWFVALWILVKGLIALALMLRVYRPATAFFGLHPAWACTLPLAGVLYGAMTLDSALRHFAGFQRGWR